MTTATTTTPSGVTTWSIDASHTEVGFAVRHLMISTVRGRFAGVAGSVSLDEGNPRNSRLDVTIDVNSIDTRQEQRDAHLRSSDFFDVAQFPTMRFVGSKIEGDITGDFTVGGELTIRGVTRPITLEATSEGRGPDPWGSERAGFSAKGKVNRSEFGLTWNQVLEAGGVTVGDEIKISIDVELVRQKESGSAA
jgi:Uncharacterized conserved protein